MKIDEAKHLQYINIKEIKGDKLTEPGNNL